MKKMIIGSLVLLIGLVTFIIINGGTKTSTYNVNTPQFKQEDYNTVLTKIESKEEGIYFFGFEACPWCQQLVPILNQSLEASKKQAYVVDIRSEQFSDALKQRLDVIYSQSKSGQTTVPFIVVVTKSGELRYHHSTLPGHDASKTALTSAQKNELSTILLNLFKD